MEVKYTKKGSGIEAGTHVSWFDTNPRQPGEEQGHYYNRFCAHMAVRSQEPEHLAYLARKEGEAAEKMVEREKRDRQIQQKTREDVVRKKRDRELEHRRKMRNDGRIECYLATGKPWRLPWARAEVSPFCDDFRPQTLMPGLGTLAIRHGLDILDTTRRNGRPVKSPIGLVATIATMVHQGRFTQWLDPNEAGFNESLVVPEGQSPFDRKAVRGDNDEWELPKEQGDWKMIVPNEDGWLPGQKPSQPELPPASPPAEPARPPERIPSLADVAAMRAELQKEREELDAKQRVMSLRLAAMEQRARMHLQNSEPKSSENPPPKTDPQPAAPPPQKTWRDIHLYSLLPEMRGVELPATWNKSNLGIVLEHMRKMNLAYWDPKVGRLFLYAAMEDVLQGKALPDPISISLPRQPGED